MYQCTGTGKLAEGKERGKRKEERAEKKPEK